ncbi:MAG: lipopolysaccharide kinase InaA family protein [Pseudomonas profundi]|uniref:lipopolysaccharide kinase InaA family protein n=1 Tax=Pseudomonas profundi TaxID=1981513 RepID=UPI003002A114
MNITEQLRRAERNPPAPFSVPLADGGELTLQRWLRILPAKRLVAQGELAGRTVLAKLFIAPAAQRHCVRELEGIKAVLGAGIATPAIISQGALPGGGHYLLTDFLEEAESLEVQWEALSHEPAGSEPGMRLLRLALTGIATMHAKGLVQRDLHLGNFLLHKGVLQVIDGDAVEVLDQRQPITAQQAEENLAVFFAQLKPDWDEWVEQLLLAYLEANPHHAIHPDNLAKLISAKRQLRLEHYLDKSLRDCTEFAVKRGWGRFAVVQRNHAAELGGLLESPDECFRRHPLLKDGGSSTVVLASTVVRKVVVKRYNIKGVAHWLKRFWRPSRAWHSWLSAHRLRFLGIATPAPLAMVEQRIGPLRSTAWLVTEYCAGVNLLEHFGKEGDRTPTAQEAVALLRLFGQLFHARISHGDCKATNLLWRLNEIVLIDLDGMRFYEAESPVWLRAWEEDRARFLRNWPAGSPLRMWLDSQLPRPVAG